MPEVGLAKLPVFVYWDANNCRPCDVELPLVMQLARAYAGRVKFVRINAEEQASLAAGAGLTAVPAQFVLKLDDKTLVYNVGFLKSDELHTFLKDGLAAKGDPGEPKKAGKSVFDVPKQRGKQSGGSVQELPKTVGESEDEAKRQRGVKGKPDPIFDGW